MKLLFLIFSSLYAKDLTFKCEDLNDPNKKIIQKQFIEQLTIAFFQRKETSYFDLPPRVKINKEINIKIIQMNQYDEKEFWIMRKREMELMNYDPQNQFFGFFCAAFKVDNSYFIINEKSMTNFQILKQTDEFKTFSYITKLKFAIKIAQVLFFMKSINFELCSLDPDKIFLRIPQENKGFDSSLLRIRIQNIKNNNNQTTCQWNTMPQAAPEIGFSETIRKQIMDNHPFKSQIFSFGYILMLLFYNEKNKFENTIQILIKNYKKGTINNFETQFNNFERQSISTVSVQNQFLFNNIDLRENFSNTVITNDKSINFKILKALIIRCLNLFPQNRPQIENVFELLLNILLYQFDFSDQDIQFEFYSHYLLDNQEQYEQQKILTLYNVITKDELKYKIASSQIKKKFNITYVGRQNNSADYKKNLPYPVNQMSFLLQQLKKKVRDLKFIKPIKDPIPLEMFYQINGDGYDPKTSLISKQEFSTYLQLKNFKKENKGEQLTNQLMLLLFYNYVYSFQIRSFFLFCEKSVFKQNN